MRFSDFFFIVATCILLIKIHKCTKKTELRSRERNAYSKSAKHPKGNLRGLGNYNEKAVLVGPRRIALFMQKNHILKSLKYINS